MAVLSIPDTGNGATVSGLGVTTNVVSIDSMTIGQTPIDITTLDTTGYKKMRPSDLREPLKLKWTYMWMGADPAIGTTMIVTTEPYAGTTFTVTFPGAGSIAGRAFVESVETPSLRNGEVMMGSCTICFNGGGDTNSPTFTAAA
jgi:hypothetical protein